MLSNEKYKGYALLQKTYTVDFLTKKRVENNGEVPQYYVEESHTAIIDKKCGRQYSLRWKEGEPMLKNMELVNLTMQRLEILYQEGFLKKGGKTTEIAIKLINEAIKVAKAVGINNTEKILPDCLAIIEQMPANAKSSMLQDVEANRQLEVDLFAGTICKLGRKYGVATPYNDVVFELLTAINERIG